MDVINGDTCTEELCKDDIENCDFCNMSFWDVAGPDGTTSLTEPDWEIGIKTVGEMDSFEPSTFYEFTATHPPPGYEKQYFLKTNFFVAPVFTCGTQVL